ncbi:MAG: hypothetical protein ABI547_07915 [Betaproteobacteria bacterium]
MEAIKLLEPYFLQLKAFIAYAKYCGESDIHAPVCRDFWTGIVAAAFFIALLLTLVIGKRMLGERLEFHRNKKRLEARKVVANDETVQERKWRGG